MNIKEIEKDILNKANHNVNNGDGLAQELQRRWGKNIAFDVVDKLQKQGYLSDTSFFMDHSFKLGYLTLEGNIYLEKLNGHNNSSNITTNFNGPITVQNLQTGTNNTINESIPPIDYIELQNIVREIREIIQGKNDNQKAYKVLTQLQISLNESKSPEKLKRLWYEFKKIIASPEFGNISSALSTAIAAGTVILENIH